VPLLALQQSVKLYWLASFVGSDTTWSSAVTAPLGRVKSVVASFDTTFSGGSIDMSG
jgi:hypothetical protein